MPECGGSTSRRSQWLAGADRLCGGGLIRLSRGAGCGGGPVLPVDCLHPGKAPTWEVVGCQRPAESHVLLFQDRTFGGEEPWRKNC